MRTTEEMSRTQALAWIAVVIWSLTGVGFALAFFAWGGPARFAVDSMRILAGAAAVAFGYGGFLAALWATRHRVKGVVLDERDAQVVARAGRATLIVVLVGVYGLSIGLWIAYEAAGAVPVGWLWFMGYGAVIAAFLVHAAATLILDARLGGHERG